VGDPILEEALASINLLISGNARNATDLVSLANEWKKYFKSLGLHTYSLADLEHWKEMVQQALSNTDTTARLQILKAVNEDALLGIILVILVLPSVMLRHLPFWWGLHFAEQQADGNIHVPAASGANSQSVWKVKSLPTASANRKYLIFSDIHRDAAMDDKGPFKPGSIDHFKANSELYGHLLDYATDNNYTVIEGGDCEELWFIGDVASYPKKTNGDLDVAEKLRLTIQTHDTIYGKLANLHGQDRYVRIQGNHDSFVKDSATRSILNTRMKQGNNKPFEIYDACIIDGVKTMFENSLLSILFVQMPNLANSQTTNEFVEKLLKGKLGLDSNDYTETCKMLICHGHQFDFWNCPENELLGMLIANSIGVPCDKLMDPLLDARGIALQGNPFYDFGEKLANLHVFNSWPYKQSSIKFAHETQHRPNSQRLLSDDYMFSESIPAIWAAGALSLNTKVAPNPDDDVGTTPAQSRAELTMSNPSDIVEYLRRHSLNHICLGHTHNPQSQPFATLDNLGKLVRLLKPMLEKLKSEFPIASKAKLKTNYFNSGTAGWMEGVIWAIEIDQTGQARLVYWTENSTKPEYMDWELQPLDPGLKVLITNALTGALDGTIDSLEQSVKVIHDKIVAMARSVEGDVTAFEKALEDFMALPFHLLAAALMTTHDQYVQAKALHRGFSLSELKNVIIKFGSGVAKAVPLKDVMEKFGSEGVDIMRRALDEQLAPLRDFTHDVIMSVKRRALQGFPNGEYESICINVPIPAGGTTLIKTLKNILSPIVAKLAPEIGVGRSSQATYQAAALVYSIVDEFPRNLPFFTSMGVLDPAMRARNTKTPVLNAFLSTLWMYPLAGTHIDIEGVRISSSFVISKNVAELTINLEKAPPPDNV
jgi:UDP-2,3-diacylglucosamine pyrophosphatase LpxH/ribosomal protein L13E